MLTANQKNILKPIVIKGLNIFPNIYLSSMHGVTDYSFRRLISHLTEGKTGLLTSEFTSASELKKNSRKALKQLKFDTQQNPFCMQIYGGEPISMAYASQLAEQKGASLIEINSGCPSPQVVRRQCGSGLLLDLNHFKEIVQAVVKATTLPVSVKVRIGFFDDQINVYESQKIAQEEGAKLFVIHGRTKEQGYSGFANWEVIHKVKQQSLIPIVGNGDVTSLSEALNKLNTYQVDGVSIGRGAIYNPWIFKQVNEYIKGKPLFLPSYEDQINLLNIYKNYLLEEVNLEIFALGRLKQMASRLLKNYSPSLEQRQSILRSSNIEDFFENLKKFFDYLRHSVHKPLS